jgi:hypothetical protein
MITDDHTALLFLLADPAAAQQARSVLVSALAGSRWMCVVIGVWQM